MKEWFKVRLILSGLSRQYLDLDELGLPDERDEMKKPIKESNRTRYYRTMYFSHWRRWSSSEIRLEIIKRSIGLFKCPGDPDYRPVG